MRLKLLIACGLTMSQHFALASQSLESLQDLCDLFPKAIAAPTGIMVEGKEIRGAAGYLVREFQGQEVNRNHYDERNGASVNTLVMHYTHLDLSNTMNIFTTNATTNRVSSHYVITQKEEDYVSGGLLLQLVPEAKRAWHAGVSSWRGMKNLNANSIGIENINRGYELSSDQAFVWFAYDPDQLATLGKLSQAIVTDYKILPQNVVGHADIAPARKQDPGILFPWETLYTTYGVGAWLAADERGAEVINDKFNPENELPQEVNEEFFLNCLREYGYEIPEGASAIDKQVEGAVLAFKSHFSKNQRPNEYTSKIDDEDMVWAWGLTAKYPH